ncbi:MAG: ABC-2 transporter permease [Lysinibacillus sp.]
MKALLHLQLKNNGRSMLFSIIFTIGISLLFVRTEDVMPIMIYALVMSSGSFRHMSLLQDKKMRYFVHSLPVSRQEIVTATYASVLVYILMIYSMIFPIQVYKGIQQSELEDFLVPFTGFLAVSIVGAAMEMYFRFHSNPFQESMTDSLLGFFGALLFILMPHFLLLLWDHEPSFYIRLLVFPAISIMLFYWSLKKSIHLYEAKEII